MTPRAARPRILHDPQWRCVRSSAFPALFETPLPGAEYTFERPQAEPGMLTFLLRKEIQYVDLCL